MTFIQSNPPHRDGQRERLIETTLDLLAYDTQNPSGQTVDLLGWLQDRIERIGVETEWIESVNGKPNLVVTIPGKSDKTLLYEGHVDTVPFDRTAWTFDPLGEQVGDRIYGRGATDMKGTIAVLVETLETFANASHQPPVTLQFAFVSDEESGGSAGIDAVLRADGVSADGAVVGETTATPDGYSVAVADKGRIWLTLAATGKAAHGSRPMNGKNAVDQLYEVVAECRDSITSTRLTYPDTVDQIVTESVEYHEHRSGDNRVASRALYEYPTVNLGRLTGGSTVNSVPQTARAKVDIRVTPGASTQEVLERIERCIETKQDITITDVSLAEGTYSDPSAQIVSAAVETGQALIGQRVYRQCATGGGDVKQLRASGIPAIELAVGSDTAHQADEFVSIEALEQTAA